MHLRDWFISPLSFQIVVFPLSDEVTIWKPPRFYAELLQGCKLGGAFFYLTAKGPLAIQYSGKIGVHRFSLIQQSV